MSRSIIPPLVPSEKSKRTSLSAMPLAEIANVQAIPNSPPPTTVILLTVLFSQFAQFFEFISETPAVPRQMMTENTGEVPLEIWQSFL